MVHPSPGAFGAHVFGLNDWTAWLDRLARSIFGMTGLEFEAAWKDGALVGNGIASDLASMLPLINRLREREQASRTLPADN